MKNTAIVTGASSGIGREISRVLVEMGYEVYGFGREFPEEEVYFHPIVCDLLNTPELERQIKEIRRRNDVSLLVNNAGVGYYGLHEELNVQKIQKLVRTNLEVPMVLTNLLLRIMSCGTVINISSRQQLSNPRGQSLWGNAAGLCSFSEWPDEVRKYGVRVVTIQPDMTKTDLYRNADFAQGEEEASYLLPEEIAETVLNILQMREGTVVTEITLRPQIHRIRRK